MMDASDWDFVGDLSTQRLDYFKTQARTTAESETGSSGDTCHRYAVSVTLPEALGGSEVSTLWVASEEGHEYYLEPEIKNQLDKATDRVVRNIASL